MVCGRNYGQNVWNDFVGFSTQPIMQDIGNLTHQVELEELTEDDVNELPDSQAEELISEDVMAIEQDCTAEEEDDDKENITPQCYLTQKMLSDAVSLFVQGLQILVSDPNRDHSIKLEHNILKLPLSHTMGFTKRNSYVLSR